jgi:signal peptidase I
MANTAKVTRIVVWSVTALLLVAVGVKVLFIGYYKIPQNGMYPTLPAGSLIWTAKRAYKSAADVKRGDVIVFTADEGGEHYIYIWRVVGLPGESVHALGDEVTINNQPVQRQPVREAGNQKIFKEQLGDVAFEVALGESAGELPEVTVTVPEGHFFVLGDNRHDAHDSRYMGPIAFTAIVGKKL